MISKHNLLAFTPFTVFKKVSIKYKKFMRDIRSLYPTIEWAKVIKLRTYIAHEYFQLHIDTLWLTVIADIPRLDREIPLFKAFIKKLQKGLIPNTSPKR